MSTAQPQSLRMALTGDSLITRRVSIYDDAPTQQLMNLLREADVSFTNLETLPNDFQGYPAQEAGGSHLGAHEWVLDDLASAGINLYAVPNNHNLDFSIAGLQALIEILKRRDVCYAGVGNNLGEARMPAYLQTPRGTVGLVACASTFAKGQQASEQRPDMLGRPGLNPLRRDTTYVVRPEQLEALKQIATDLGVEQQRQQRVQLGFGFPPDDPDVFPFMDNNFVAGDEPATRTKSKVSDLTAICSWIEEAARRSDLVVASFHGHEQGSHKEEPAEFLVEFAHAAIDAGANVVVGHGPHLLRGVEIYKGRPIFYSLGNFIGQNELVYKLPSDAYERFRVDPEKHPSELFAQRSQDDTKGFPSDQRYWESMVPVCEWSGTDLCSVKLHPVTLGLGERVFQRGRPRMATGQHATEILNRVAELSEPYGTQLDIQDGVAKIKLG